MNRVLIVDDKPENLYMLRALLQGHGYVVEEARHGAEALVKARQAPPAMIISDLLMPMMDGYSLLKQWKADERLKIIPFVVYTATYTDPKDERLALNLGADVFIIKPAEPEPFMARIREVLSKKERGELPLANETQITENAILKEYSEAVVRKLEDKIRQLEQANADLHLRERAIGAATQGLLITDPNQPDNGIVYASPGFERITGYRADEVIGRNCRFLQGKDTDRAAVAQLREAILAGQPFTVELLNYRKDGSPFWNELSVSPIRDAAGLLTHFVGVQADVTQRRLLEEQFRQSQKMEAIGQLAGGVAHDFNNLLCIINGYSELLLQNMPTDHPSYELLNEIRSAGDRSASLTRQLLVFSRKQVVAPKVLDLNAVVVDAEKILRWVIGEDVRLTTSLAGRLGRVRADEGQLQQVLLNLAVNARDAMPQGGRLTIETRNVKLDEEYCRNHAGVPPGPYVLLAVSDTGCGMTAAVRARIFEPFFTTKEAGKGTGLGLAVVHGVVKQAGGRVEVYSEVGVGTTFKVYLPSVDQQAQPAKSLSDNRPPPRGTETVLLLEDEDGVRALTRHVLAGCGYQVLEAADGNEGLLIAGRHGGPIHLLVTDVVMPGLNGRQVAERLLALHPGMKVLYVSGYTDDAIVRHGVLEDQTHFLQKPFSPLALAFKVREVLGPSPPGRDSPPS